MKQSEFSLVISKSIKDNGLWLALLSVCLFIQLFHGELTFRFDRNLIEQGQWWRLITGHLTHLNWMHFLLNMAGMAIVTFFFAAYQTMRYWISALIFLSLACSAGLILDNQLDRYVGLSGVLHGLFIIGGFLELKHYKSSGVIILLLITGKIIWEQMFGALPASESMVGGKVALNAHLYGSLAGFAYIALTLAISKGKEKG